MKNRSNTDGITVAVIVAHPDDESLWAGGTILSHPLNNWIIVSLCRGSDQDRSPKFHQALLEYNAEGVMGDLDDGPEQKPLFESEVEEAIMQLLPQQHYDLIITHNPSGEYTRHIRHQEVSGAVIRLWRDGRISTSELWTFAYEDGKKKYYPRPIPQADIFQSLPEEIWLKKYDIITKTYGFKKDSWEAKIVPGSEAFWQFTDPVRADQWLNQEGIKK